MKELMMRKPHRHEIVLGVAIVIAVIGLILIQSQ
jgi:hypothetical protein